MQGQAFMNLACQENPSFKFLLIIHRSAAKILKKEISAALSYWEQSVDNIKQRQFYVFVPYY